MASINVLKNKYACANLMDLQVLEQLRADLKIVSTEEVVTLEDHIAFLGLVRSFRVGLAKSDSLKGDNYPSLLASLLSVGEDGLYSNNLRFLYELIQNVDDCNYDDPSNANLEVRFDPALGRIILTYNEQGFTPFNVFAITGIAEAAKNISADKVEIGEKGIGFKSVFGVATKVLIQSGMFSFELHKDNFTVPVPIYEGFAPVIGTRLTLFVQPGKVESIYRAFFDEYCRKDALFNKNPLLFLNKLTKLRLYVDSWRSMTFSVSRNIQTYPDGLTCEDGVDLSVDLKEMRSGVSKDYQQKVICRRYTKPILYNRSACCSRYGPNTTFDSKRMLMQIVVPEVDDLYGEDPITSGTLYSFLPTQIRLTVPLVCHVPFKLDGSREFVDPQNQNEWFRYSSDSFAVMVKEVLHDLSRRINEDIVHYVPGMNKHLFEFTNSKVRELLTPEFSSQTYLALPIFKSVENRFLPASEVFCFAVDEDVPDPESTYLLLGGTKELFLPDKRAMSKNPGIPLVTNVAEKLFGQAMRVPESTLDALSVLANMERFSFEKAIEHIHPYSFDAKQVEVFSRFAKCTEAFRKKAVAHIRSANIPAYKIDPSGLRFMDIRELDDREPLEMADFETNACRYLNAIGWKCVLLPNVPDQFFFAACNVLILSASSPLHALSEFCRNVDGGTFAASLRFRSASRQLNDASKDMSSDEYMKLLVSVRKVIRSSFGQGVYENYISLINQAGTDPDRYLNELLQNADDCDYPDGVVPEFQLKVDSTGTVLETQYNECGFQREHVRSITAIGESTKKIISKGHLGSLNEIGEKGIGFKAVFGAAKEVQIHSGAFHFSLSDKTPTIPKVLKSPEDSTDGTRMILELKKPFNQELLSEQAVLNMCMCLRQLRILRLGNHYVEITDDGMTRTIHINRKKYAFWIVRYPFRITDEAAIKERSHNSRRIKPDQKIICYLPQKGSKREQLLYTGLPTKVTSKLHMIIDAPFELTTDRSGILNNRWNTLVTEAVHKAVIRCIEQMRSLPDAQVMRYMNFRKEGERYLLDLFSDPMLNNGPFLSLLHKTAFLPTFAPDFYVRPSDFAYRVPDVVQYLLQRNEVRLFKRNQFLAIPENYYELQFAALNVREMAMTSVVNYVKPLLSQYIANQDFRSKLYSYFTSHSLEIPTHRAMLKLLTMIPVKGRQPGTVDYVAWSNSIYAKDGATVSPDNYSILATDYLSKQQFSTIYGNGISEMDAKGELLYYRDALEQKLDNTHDPVQLYAFLMNEFRFNFAMLAKCTDTLVSRKERIPLKNELGHIRVGRVYVSDEAPFFYEGTLFQKHVAAQECKRLAGLIGCKKLEEVYFEDLDIRQPLTEDDLDYLQSVVSLQHGFEILLTCKRRGLIPQELRDDLNIDGLSPVVEECDPDEIDKLFNDPVGDPRVFQKHMQKVIDDRAEIIHRDVTRSVRYIRYRSGKEEELRYADIRTRAIQRYSLPQKDLCVCQMCQTTVRPQYVKVNNAFKAANQEHVYYWKECGLTFCLMCSKHYEELRQNDDFHGRFIDAIRHANANEAGTIQIPIGTEKVRFSQKHLAELQEILDVDL